MRITDYFIKTAERFPEKLSFADDRESLTFKELYEKALAFAAEIKTENMPVMIETDRTVMTPVRIMGVLLSGNYYVPVDAKAPKERKDEIARQLSSAAPKEGLAYILFTSGSTGKPKGVEIEEGSVINFARRFISAMHVDESFVFGNQAPFCFDASMEELYASFFAGASTYILPKKVFSFPKLFSEYINKNGINTLNLSGSAFGMIASSGVLESYPVPGLRLVMAGNEMVHTRHLNIWKKACPSCRFVNAYGPTEATVESTYFFADRDISDDELLPIGKPCEGVRIFLVDGSGNEITEKGAENSGEMYIAGPGLARGYFNDPEKTASAFTDYRGLRVYRTGDRAYLDENGDLVFIGRSDNQIKHLGYRIELGEIESVISNIKGVSLCACIFLSEKDRIICFFAGDAKEDELAKECREKLLSYMVPGQFVKLGCLPLNINEKVDRKALLGLALGE